MCASPGGGGSRRPSAVLCLRGRATPQALLARPAPRCRLGGWLSEAVAAAASAAETQAGLHRPPPRGHHGHARLAFAARSGGRALAARALLRSRRGRGGARGRVIGRVAAAQVERRLAKRGWPLAMVLRLDRLE